MKKGRKLPMVIFAFFTLFILVMGCGGGGGSGGNNNGGNNGGGGVTVAPSAPSSLTATAVSATQINLAWTRGSTNESGFKIERRTVPAASPKRAQADSTFTQINTVSAGITSYQDTGLAASTNYEYRVRAYNSAGDSGYSNTYTANTGGVGCTGTGGPLQGTWHWISKWNNGDTSNHAMLYGCQNNNNVTFTIDCGRQYQLATATITGSVLNVTYSYSGGDTWVGTIHGNTISGPDTDDESGPGTTYMLKKDSTFVCSSGSYVVTGTVDGTPVNINDTGSSAAEWDSDHYLQYNFTLTTSIPFSYILEWDNPYPPTGIQTYQVRTSDQGSGTVQAIVRVVNSWPPDFDNIVEIQVVSGTITLTRYTQRYSGPTSGMAGTFNITLENGRGQLSGSFDTPFFLEFTDPFINLP